MPAHESKGKFSKSQQKNFKRTLFHKQQCSSVAIQPFRTGSAPAEAYLYQDYCALSSSHPMCPCVPVPFLTLLVSDRTKKREGQKWILFKRKRYFHLVISLCLTALLVFWVPPVPSTMSLSPCLPLVSLEAPHPLGQGRRSLQESTHPTALGFLPVPHQPSLPPGSLFQQKHIHGNTGWKRRKDLRKCFILFS